MNADLTTALRDIHDIDPAGWWPPAPGWWLLFLLVVALGVVLLPVLRRLKRGEPALRARWQRDGASRLGELRRRLDSEDEKQIAVEFSELLRRISIARCGRDACAGLSGAEWLQWLNQHDPEEFDWTPYRRQLLHAPYAPPGSLSGRDGMRRLIDAAMNWTKPANKHCAARAGGAYV